MSRMSTALEHRSARVLRGLTAAWVFALVLALYPYAASPAAPVKHLLSGWLVVLMALAALWGAARGELALSRRGVVPGLAAAFLGWHAISALLSPFPQNGLFSLRVWLTPALLVVLLPGLYREPRRVWGLFLTVALAVALSSIYGFLQRFGLDPFPWSARDIEEYAGLPSTYANPNFAGHTLVIAVFLAAGLALWHRRWRWAALACLVLIAAHLYLTHMRGARVALVAAVLVTAATARLHRRGVRPAVAIAAVAGGGMLAAACAAAALLAYGALSPGNSLPLDGASVLRLNGYHGAASMLWDSPWSGHGPGSFDWVSPKYWTPYEQQWFANEGKKNDHVHNDLLETATDAGLPGAALYLALLLFAIVQSLWLALTAAGERRALGLVFACCFTAFAVDGQFGFNLRVPVSAGFLFLLLALLHAQTAPPGAGRRFQIPVALAAVLFATLAALAHTAAFKADTLLQQARSAMAYANEQRTQGNAEMSRAALLAGIQMAARGERWQPWDMRLPEAAAACAAGLGRHDEADAALARAIGLAPHHPSLHTQQAQARAAKAFHRDSLAVYGDGPDPAMPALLAAAADSARAALALCPALAAAEEVLGRTAAVCARHAPADAHGHWSAAREYLGRALQHGAQNRADLNLLLARACVALGDTEGAKDAFARALESAPAHEEAWDEFLAFAREAKRIEPYLDLLARLSALGRDGANDELLLRLGGARLRDGRDLKAARATALEVLRRSPTHPGAWGLLVLATGPATPATLAKVASGFDLSAAPAWLQRLAAGAADDAYAGAAGMAAAAARTMAGAPAPVLERNFAWAATLLRNGITGAQLGPVSEGNTLLAIAEIQRYCGRWRESAGAAARAASLLAGTARAQALELHAHALLQQGRTQEALTAARAAAELAPADKLIRHTLARALAAAGGLAEASFEYGALLQAPPMDPLRKQAITREANALQLRLAEEKQP